MRRYRSLTIQIAAFAVVITLPLFAHAATTNFFGPIIPNNLCNCQSLKSAPDFGCILQTMQVALNTVVSFATVLITIYIAWAGIGFIANPTSPEARNAGVARITNAVIGLLIVLCAWLLVDTVMKVVYNQNASGTDVASLGPWNSILNDTNPNDYCLKIVTPGTLPSLIGATNASGGTPSTPPNVGNAGGACSSSAIEAAVQNEGGTISPTTAEALACVAGPESTCGTVYPNYSWDKANKSGYASTAYGPFQVLLSSNAKYFNNPQCEAVAGSTGPLNCNQAFTPQGFSIPGSTLDACEKAAGDLGCDAIAASQLYATSGITPWTTDSHATTQASCGR